MAHALATAFARVGRPLHPTLVDMLDEHFSHRTERRGCGYAQATRWLGARLSERVLDAGPDLGVFDCPIAGEGSVRVATGALAAAVLPWAPGAAVTEVEAQLTDPCSRALLPLVAGLIAPDPAAREVAPMRMRGGVGSCPQAEEFFLEVAHGRVRRGGALNVIVDAGHRPLLLEKLRLGDSHSAISLQPLRFNGACVPAGALWSVGYAARTELPWAPTRRGHCVPLASVACLRLLRLSTLAIEPSDRPRAFSSMLEAQVQAGLYSPGATTLADLRRAAELELL